jgi:oxygen-independent coproporphyrinogen III oxidase
MLPFKSLWKPVIQKMVTGKLGRFRMVPLEPEMPADLHRPGLYLHVPFCKNLCPFCPYNRIEYDEELWMQYERAVHEEIEIYKPHLKGHDFVSLYVGGGTPTVNLQGLIRIVGHLQRAFNFTKDICIELHPGNMEKDCLNDLKDSGVTMVSIGVESMTDSVLKAIGRNHDGETAVSALKRAVNTGFKSVNVDLMFALPGQTLSDWERDIRSVINEGADQISTYPLFSFPYSDLGINQNLHQIKRPDGALVRSMLKLTNDYALGNGYERCAVWSWLKPEKNKFSSITRHHYIGFGPSAASMTGKDFYVNTFDVGSYAQSLPKRRPVALCMPVDRRLEMAYWLYWRVYELKIMHHDFHDLFGEGNSLDSHFSHLFRPLMLMGMINKKDGGYKITPSGAYWIHRLQNEYSLNYINRLWGTCRRQPWPAEVFL